MQVKNIDAIRATKPDCFVRNLLSVPDKNAERKEEEEEGDQCERRISFVLGLLSLPSENAREKKEEQEDNHSSRGI